MPKIDVTIKNATKIPLLGVKSQPSPYIIMQCQQVSYTSSIAKYSQNPIWNYHTTIQAKKVTSYINFYIYNNNPNAVDELLAYSKIQFGQLMTRTNTESKLRLMNSLQEPINSYLFVEHYDCNPADLHLPLGERTCIKLRLINDIPEDSYFICQYGDSSFNLSQQMRENAFRYNAKYDRIKCILQIRSSKQEKLQNQILISNIGVNNCITMHFYSSKKEHTVFLSACIILNGLLPQNYNILSAKILDVKKSNGKKNNNYKIRMNGPLNQCIFNQKAQSEIYVQNNSQVLIQYYQQNEGQGFQPYCSFQIILNSLNWSKQLLQCQHEIQHYDNYKNIGTSIVFKFSIRKNFELSKIIPKLINTQIVLDYNSPLVIQQIKMQNVFLYQVIKNNQVGFVHRDSKRKITMLNRFRLSQNKIDFVIQTRQILNNLGKGTLYLINLDQSFIEGPSKTFQDSLIFQINIEQFNKIQESKVIYSSKFLAFAKKASVVNICKKLNKMIHDDLLKFKVKSRSTGTIKKGILKIINMKCTGPFGQSQVSITVDSINKQAVGQIGNYLMDKNISFYVDQGNINIKVTIQNLQEKLQANNQNKHKIESCYFGNFCDFFGTPTNFKMYSQQIKLTSEHKLQIIYSFQQGEKLMQLAQRPTEPTFFRAKDNICLRLKRAFVGINNKPYIFKISRGNYTYESHQYRCSNNKIYFSQSETLSLAIPHGQQINPIFVSCYSYDQQDRLMIYNGFINVTDICGKGQYEIILLYQKQQKRKEIFFIMQVPHSLFLVDQISALIKLAKISSNTTSQLFRTIYKHYLLIKVNNYQYQICQCTMNEQSLTLNASINLRKSDILIFQLYSSYKPISKQLFLTSQKELIGCAYYIWQQIQQSGSFILSYFPKKESQLKYTKNSLIMQQRSYQLYIFYETQQSKLQARAQPIRSKPSLTDIDVLNKGVINLYIKQFWPVQLDNKIISVQIRPIHLLLSSQSGCKINRSFMVAANNMEFQLQACITTKEGEKYKRITCKAYVKLRSHHYKTNTLTSLIIHFQKYFYLTSDFVILHNKFISTPEGTLNIKQIATRGVKIDKFDVSFANQMINQQILDELIKKEGSEAKCNISVKTNYVLNSLIFNLQTKKAKIKQKIYLSQINIQKYEEQFLYERQILVSGQSLILSLTVSYSCVKQNQKQQISIKYILQNSKNITIMYPLQHFNMLTTIKQKQQQPNKNIGFHLKFTLPIDIAIDTKQLQVYIGKKEPIKLNPSVSKNQEYTYYSNTMLQVKTLKLINKQFVDKPVEALGKQKNVWKFMIDQNPKLIVTLEQTSCSISSIANQNWTFKFHLHRLIALNRKRLLSLKNTPNDQILTKQLAIVVKHGKQHHFIRNLDEFGSIKTIESTLLQFGYDNSCNIVQVFLIIDNYFNRQTNNFQKLSLNWMQLFPISYGVINLSYISPGQPFGFELKPLENHSYNLQKAINRLVIRQQDINCLCSVSFSKKSWGFITLKLIGCTAINFIGRQKEQMYIYFKVQVQDSNRIVACSFNSEARAVSKTQNLEFTTNKMDFLFIQKNIEDNYSLKITAFLLDNGKHFAFVEKKQEISDYLQRRGNHDINIQIKSNQTNNLCKNTFQIALELSNAMSPPQKQNLIQKAKSINKVDALSFREIGNIQFFQRLIGCQQLSHFNQCLEQIKESFIYQQDSQYVSFVFLVEYLSYNFDAKLIGEICEIIHLNLLKCPQIISKLEQQEITKILYDYFKLICERQRRKVPSKVAKVTNEEYMITVGEFKEKKNLSSLRQVLQKQQYLLYTPDQLLASLSSRNNQIVLNIINLLLKNSNHIKNSLSQDIDQWIQMFGFTTQENQFQLFLLVLKNCLLYGEKLNQQKLHRLIDILLQRLYNLSMVFQFWQQIEQQQEKINLYQSVLNKYERELSKSCVQTCRGLKMMVSQLINSKDAQSIEYFSKLHGAINKVILQNISSSSDIILLSSHLDFLSFLFEKKLIEEKIKDEISHIIKNKLQTVKDNSAKLILNNYANKFKVKLPKIVNSNKKQVLKDEMANKAGFYKKYLITND